MTNEQTALIEQLLFNGFAQKSAKILGGNAILVLNSLTTGNQLKVESEMKTLDGTPAFMVHTYSLKLVSEVLKSFTYNGKTLEFESPTMAYDFLLSRPATVVDAIIQVHSSFEKELADLSKQEALAENFTKTPSTESAPN